MKPGHFGSVKLDTNLVVEYLAEQACVVQLAIDTEVSLCFELFTEIEALDINYLGRLFGETWSRPGWKMHWSLVAKVTGDVEYQIGR